jgi:uncharacterized protein YndB with AHSA1/START domain
MLKDLSVTKSIHINADSSTVWDALTDSAIIRQYFFGTEVSSSWDTGSPILFRGEWEGQQYEDKGVILGVKPGKLLRYSYWSGFSGLEDRKQNYSEVHYELENQGVMTIVRVSQSGFANEKAKEHSENGWEMVLSNMKKIIETNG